LSLPSTGRVVIVIDPLGTRIPSTSPAEPVHPSH
jgi:hypothetical protein